MFRRFFPGLACSSLIYLIPSAASAHITMSDPPPRVTSSGSGPCGSGEGADTFSATPTAFDPGATVTIKWSETIPHRESVYNIILASSDAGLADPDGSIQGGMILASELPEEDDSEYEAEVTLPDEICEACTIQVIQAGNANYYQCTDITIGADDAGGGSGGDSGTDDGAGGSDTGEGAGGGDSTGDSGGGPGVDLGSGGQDSGDASGGSSGSGGNESGGTGGASSIGGNTASASGGSAASAAGGSAQVAPSPAPADDPGEDAEAGCAFVPSRASSHATSWVFLFLALLPFARARRARRRTR